MVRRILVLISWWAAFAGLWLLYVGTKARLELYAGLIAAGVAVAGLEIVRRQGVLAFRPDRRFLARLALLPLWVVFDFGVVTVALVRSVLRGRRVEGVFLAVPFPAGDEHARYAFRRALAEVAGTIDANAIVLDVDAERKLALLHSIDPRRRTGKEAL